MTAWVRLCIVVTILMACGHRNGTGTPDPDATGGPGDDASVSGSDSGVGIDAPPFDGTCDAISGAQCSNCKDDDEDGRIDGFDPECTGASDDDESSFSTGIPGDNKDEVMQDCFFDGDSGGGNDGCDVHICCLLGATTVAECTIGANRYDPKSCPPPIGTQALPASCIEKCGKLTPPGCDCFGCCTICNPDTNECKDIILNPVDSMGCTLTTLGDPTKCLACEKNAQCGNSTCGGDTCVLCPGQDPSDLPPSCGGATECPIGTIACTDDGMCGDLAYCANGCCIGVIQ
jgi:hypothetical protein